MQEKEYRLFITPFEMPLEAWKCLVIDDVHPSLFPVLERAGIEVSYQPEIKPDAVPQALSGKQVLVVRSKVPIGDDLLEHAKDLKLVARAGAGVDNLDEQALIKRGIRLVNAPEGNRDAVGEHTLGMLLCLLNKLHTADRQVRNKVWEREPNRGTELGGKTVGIIGYGNMGRSFARRLSGFGCRLLVYDKYQPLPTEDLSFSSSLLKIQQEADIVSLHVPLTSETRKMINHDWFSACSKPILLLNTSRGEVVDQHALVEHLKLGTVWGAGLDVLENEKLTNMSLEQQQDFAYLTRQDNVLLSPHVAGWSIESYARISTVLGIKITEYCLGKV